MKLKKITKSKKQQKKNNNKKNNCKKTIKKSKLKLKQYGGNPLSIGDINRDRKADIHDKNIVRNILDSSVIANKGGVGFYPGTMVLHMDVRGHGARWNKYKQKK